MSERNPPLAVEIGLSTRDARRFERILRLLSAADNISLPEGKAPHLCQRVVIHPSKHVTNYAFWAENVVNVAKHYDFPALIVRI